MTAHSVSALAALLLLGNAQPPSAAALTGPPTAAEIASAAAEPPGYRSYPMAPLTAWDSALRRALAGGDADRAADTLAPRFGLAGAQMRELVRLWLIVDSRRYRLDREPGARETLRRAFYALAARAPRNPLVLQAAAESLEALQACRAEDFDALMAGTADPAGDAWMIANAAPCLGNFVRAAAAAPGRGVAPLVQLLTWGALDVADSLALYHWLSGPAALAHVAEGDRAAFAGWLRFGEARLLFETGLTEQAVALLEGLPAAERARALVREAGETIARIDGLPVKLSQERTDEKVKFYLAAAYALAGRTAEAEALFGALRQLPAARRALACALRTDPPPTRGAPSGPCGQIDYNDSAQQTVDLMLLDHLLHHPDDDPYPLAEAGLSGMGAASGDGVAELRCRIFADPGFGTICDGARSARAYLLRVQPGGDGSDHAAQARQLAALPLPGFAEARTAFAAALARVAATLPPVDTSSGARASIRPAPSPFAEQPLPAAFRGPRPAPTRPPAGTGNLPEGFMPVRFERNGNRAVAISVSQTLDPTGEASQGGYWVHLSQDGGRHWQAPLYTGLAQNFPYVVPSASRLPLIEGEALNLEVEVQELDTASITYPPVAMQTRRRAANLYLHIPLAELARDSDGDGVTNIAARSLLLDQARSDGGTPFVVGSDRGAGCTAPTAERTALVALLERLFSGGTGALVEPVDRPASDPLAFGWRGAGAAADRPIFIRGEARDYLCLRPRRLMVVYSEADVAALKRFHPDFHAVAMPRIVYNRAHDRGYVIWSAGWRGGTYRLRLVDGRWQFDSISEWIS